ncbi:MAG: EAL domain-containing protein [Pseudomonadales bacterium]|nr:EAL domain-containing protein [Pseudomonadales bacterium]
MFDSELPKGLTPPLAMPGLSLLQAGFSHFKCPVFITTSRREPSCQKIVFANAALEKMTGYSASELEHQDMRIFMGQATRADDIEMLKDALNNKKPLRRELILNYKYGEECWVELEGAPLDMDDFGRYWLWMMRDISARVVLMHAMAQRENRWRLAIDSIGDGVWDWHISKHRIDYSEHWKHLLGYEETEISNSRQELISRIHADDLPAMEQALNLHLQGESNNYQNEYRILCKDGKYKWVLDRGVVVSCDEEGAATRMIGACTDISSRKKTEELLFESEQRHRVLIDNLQSGVVVHAPDTSILLCNLQASNLLSYSLAQMQGVLHDQAEWYFIDNKKQRLAVDDYPVNEVVNSGVRITDKLLGIQQRGSENIHWLMINAYPEYDENKELSHIVVTFVDMTERVQAEDNLRLSEERFQLAAKGASFGVWDWEMSSDAIFYSDRCKEMLDYSNAEFPDKTSSFLDIIHQDDKLNFRKAIASHLAGETKAYEMEMRLRNRAGQYRWFYLRGEALRDEHGQPYRMAGSVIDITDSRKIQQELELAAMVYEHSSEAMMVNDAKFNVIAINPAFTLMTGFTGHEMIGQSSRRYISDIRDEHSFATIQKALFESGCWQGEIWSRRCNGDEIAQSLTINAIYHKDGKVHRYVTLFSDVTEKLKSEEMIWHQANYDNLTDLPNRNMFSDRMEQEVSKGKREHNPFVLLFVDLDRFKEVNDTLGHLMGDVLLIEAAKRIRYCVRETDSVARQGGDEFSVMLCGLHEQNQIERVVQSMIHALAEPFNLDGEKVFISGSIGVTLYPDDADNMQDLFKYADQAMYQAKKLGRNRYSYFTRALQQAADKRMYLTRELRNAINTEQFEVYYQPIVDLLTGETYKAEALIRWLHPEKGIVSPNDFIPLAEDTGLIIELGEWVFKQAATQAKQWRAEFIDNFQISVNKSPVQFIETEKNRGQSWLDYLQENDIPGEAIVIEITEGILLDTPDLVLEKMQAFHQAGIGISLDDFGTGYSSLSYLKKFDIDYIKIDRSFVMNIEENTDDLALCEAIVVMAHKLGLKVIAEGVETCAQRDLLAIAGCDYAQGYLYSKPIPSDNFAEYLQSPSSHLPH